MSEELAWHRVERADDCLKVRPIDLLRAAAHDIETGKIQCDAVLILYAHRPQDAAWTLGDYRAGLSRDQQLVLLEMGKRRCIDRWINP
jgi:hypothetical protein